MPGPGLSRRYDAGQECDIVLATPPADVAAYSRAKARAGRLDEWTALNR